MNNDYLMPPISTTYVAHVNPMVINLMPVQMNVDQYSADVDFNMTQDLFSSPLGMSTPGRTMPAGTGNYHRMWPCNNVSKTYIPSPPGIPTGCIENAGASRYEDSDTFGVNKRVSRSKLQCSIDGCTKTFQKTEHLKRHQKVMHSIGGTAETFACPAEGCNRSFKGRADNFKQHLKLHKNGNSKRTPYSELAAVMYDKLCSEGKTRNTR